MKRWTTAAVVVASVLGAQVAHAQAIQNVVLRNSFNPTGAGARGLGMGGAFIAVADDGTAASFNPAGLAPAPADRVRRRRLHRPAQLHRDRAGTGTEDQSFESHARHQRPDFFGLALPFESAATTSPCRSLPAGRRPLRPGRATVPDTIALAELIPT